MAAERAVNLITPAVELHLDRGDRLATLYVREPTGHDASVPLDAHGLRDLVARSNTALLVLDPPQAGVVRAEVLARSFAISFERLRDMERVDPVGAANLRATIAAEVRRWYALDAVPLEVVRG